MHTARMHLTTVAILLSVSSMAYGRRFIRSATATSQSFGPCDTFATCSQLCGQSSGQLACSCIEGFHLNHDNKSCDITDPEWKMLYNTWSNRVGFIERNAEGEVQRSFISPMGHPIFVSFDARNNTVYWTEGSVSTKAVYKKSLSGSGDVEVVVNSGLGHPEGIAYDWLTGNVYLADYGLSQIIVCNQNPTICTVLIEDKLDLTRDIALHPNKGLMFWTDWGETPSIIRAGMDGRNPVEIVSTGLGWPNGIAIDEGNSRIYWVDAKTKKMESSTLSGADRQLISTEIKHPFGVDVFGDRVYWSDWDSHAIKSVHKFTGGDVETIFSDSVQKVNGIAIMHVAKQPILRSNPCDNANCSHICALTAEPSPSQFRCLCPSGMVLDQQTERKCIDDNEDGPEILLASQNTLTMLPFNKPGTNNVEHVDVLPQIKSINAIVYSPSNQSIIMSVRLENSDNVIAQYTLQSKQYSVLVSKNISNVTALDIDFVGENLYWIDSGKQTVEAMSMQTGDRTVLLSNVESLLDILFVPDNGTLYISKVGSIHKLSLRQQISSISLFLSVSTREPIELFYDREGQNILWVCKTCNKIESTPINGRSLTKTIYGQILQSIQAILKYGNDIYFVDSSSSVKFVSASKGTEQLSRSFKTTSFAQSGKKMMILVNVNISRYDQLRHTHECSPINSHRKACSHICLSTGAALGGECRCPVDLVLSDDDRTCARKQDRILVESESVEENEMNWPSSERSITTERTTKAPPHVNHDGKNADESTEKDGILSTSLTNNDAKNVANAQSSVSDGSAATITAISAVIIAVLLVTIAALVIHWRRTRSIPLLPKPFFIR